MQRFLETLGVLLIGEGFSIFPLTLSAERQGSTLHNGCRSSKAMGLPEQTQGVRDALLTLVLAPMIERAAHEELTELLLIWLIEARRGEKRRREPLESIARVVSWAMFGSAVQWSQEETTVSSEEMADVISQVIMEGVAHRALDALSK